MCIHIETGLPRFNPCAFDPATVDYIGRRIKRSLTVLRRLPDAASGERVWEAVCILCGRHFALTVGQIENARFEPCGCGSQRGKRNGRTSH